MEQVLGYGSAVIIGLVLGMIGGGGSILAVPALVYILDIDPVMATAYSLFIVGLSSLAGSYAYMRRSLVDYKTAAVFALPAFIAVFTARKFIIPAIPELIFTWGNFAFTKDIAIMALFSLLMIAASVSMIRKPKAEEKEGEKELKLPVIMVEGIVVGLLTGLVGAGGGFLIIPALVILAKLPMKTAVGTSLLIIAVKSLIGFIGDVSEHNIDWMLLGAFTLFTIGGIAAGSFLSKYVSAKKLKPAFGWFVLVMGVFIIAKEFYQGI